MILFLSVRSVCDFATFMRIWILVVCGQANSLHSGWLVHLFFKAFKHKAQQKKGKHIITSTKRDCGNHTASGTSLFVGLRSHLMPTTQEQSLKMIQKPGYLHQRQNLTQPGNESFHAKLAEQTAKTWPAYKTNIRSQLHWSGQALKEDRQVQRIRFCDDVHATM